MCIYRWLYSLLCVASCNINLAWTFRPRDIQLTVWKSTWFLSNLFLTMRSIFENDTRIILKDRATDFYEKSCRAKGDAKNLGYFVWKITILRQKNLIFSNCGGRRPWYLMLILSFIYSYEWVWLNTKSICYKAHYKLQLSFLAIF